MAKENVFDERGETVAEVVVDAVADEPAAAPEEVVAAPVTTGVGKYRVGGKLFERQEEALEEATRLLDEQREIDAYRQGQRSVLDHAAVNRVASPDVTQVPIPDNTEELYTNPQEFLRKRDEAIEQRVIGKVTAAQAQTAESDRIWREFTDRHPRLAEFRKEVEQYVADNQQEVRVIAGAKGLSAAYDTIANRLQASFSRYAEAVKPTRELANTGAAATPAGKSAPVTSAAQSKKPATMIEQMRSMRSTRR